MTGIIPYLFYRRVPDALDWLARAFGFVEELRHETPSGGMHAHHARAAAAGAGIVEPPKDEPYGRTYTVRDLEGHPWFFTRAP